jgi:methylthioribulose-1-phosphate dehydratase
MPIPVESAIREIIAVGRRLDARGLAPATSGNYSMRVSDGQIAITVSGRHKGRLRAADVMLVDGDGRALDGRKPSAETPLHLQLYRLYPRVQAVLHVHSVAAVALTRLSPDGTRLSLQGYEMLKAFPGVTTHEARVDIPVFENSQDTPDRSSRPTPFAPLRDPLVCPPGLPCFYPITPARSKPPSMQECRHCWWTGSPPRHSPQYRTESGVSTT